MTHYNKRRLFILAAFITTMALIWTNIMANFNKRNVMLVVYKHDTKNLEIHRPTTPKRRKQFVYLVQTEECLPQRLLDKHHIGMQQQSRFDVIVLSFKRPCQEKNETLSAHVEYLFPGTDSTRISWSEGRNLLYRKSKVKSNEYLYYVFMDDDLDFSYNKEYTPSWMRSVSPMRSFENFLLEYEPALGVLNYQVHHSADIMIKKIKSLCKKNNYNPTALYVPIIHFDASFNAFHKDAVDHILPYPTKYDNINWWHSQRYVIAATEMKFRGQSYLFTPVNSINTRHGDYPRNDENANQVWSLFVKDLASSIPAEYRKEEWIQEFAQNPAKHTENSVAICWKFPRRYPIKPFAHFAFNND